MKKLKLAVAVALALGVGSQVVNAVPLPAERTYLPMNISSEKTGDALLFPMYFSGGDNYFTISNLSGSWIQGHLRFRGAAWTGELLDMDIILSPGDVFVFRVADIDGDGMWEVDQSLDVRNFQYTGLERMAECGGGIPRCMEHSEYLIPKDASGNVVAPLAGGPVDYHRTFGYIEFIGEAVLDGVPAAQMYAEMAALINPANAGKLAYQRRVDNQLGTSAWAWVNKNGSAGPVDTNARPLSDVLNVLSGTAFIAMPGMTAGLAYNAESIVNFRTVANVHRVDNYAPNTAVILHTENPSAPDAEPYLYGYREESRGGQTDESLVSFNNTWGPTLSDGDDYDLTGLRGGNDDWDDFHARPNSIGEVEEAIRQLTAVPLLNHNGLAGQTFTSFYFDNNPPYSGGNIGGGLMSLYFFHFPTKFYYGEDTLYWMRNVPYRNSTDQLLGPNGYLHAATAALVERTVKDWTVELWDTTEQFPTSAPPTGCTVSPCPPPTTPIGTNFRMHYELTLFGIKDLKNVFGQGVHQVWPQGRVVLRPVLNPSYNWPSGPNPLVAPNVRSWPAMAYTFELGSPNAITHWRLMHMVSN